MEALGHRGLTAVYDTLRDEYSISRDELPYRIDTLYQILEHVFGVYGAKTLGSVIAEKFYSSQRLLFHNHDGYSFQDYVQEAKSKINEPHETG